MLLFLLIRKKFPFQSDLGLTDLVPFGALKLRIKLSHPCTGYPLEREHSTINHFPHCPLGYC